MFQTGEQILNQFGRYSGNPHGSGAPPKNKY
jgi:hypothetical protein